MILATECVEVTDSQTFVSSYPVENLHVLS